MPFKRISAYNANRLLTHEFEDGVWLSFHDDDPTDAGLNEIAGVGRVFVDNWSTPASKATHNVDEVLFTDLPECELHHIGAWDSEEGGNFLRSTPRMTGSPLEFDPLEISAGSTVRLAAETCTFRFSNVDV